MWQHSLFSSWIVIVSHKICSSTSGSFWRLSRVLSIVQFTQLWHFLWQTRDKLFCNNRKLNVQEKCEENNQKVECSIILGLCLCWNLISYTCLLVLIIVHILFPAFISIKIAWFVAIYFLYAKKLLQQKHHYMLRGLFCFSGGKYCIICTCS